MEINKIHQEFQKSLYQFISSRVKDRDDAADILQEVFIKIAAKINTLADGEKLKSWIFAITRNTIIDHYRKHATHVKTDLTEKIINETMGEEDTDSTKGLEKCLKAFIQKLPGEYREIIIESELKGIKQKDLAAKYSMPYSSVRSRVQRGRIRLKEMLLNCCSIEADSRGNIVETNCATNCNNCN